MLGKSTVGAAALTTLFGQERSHGESKGAIQKLPLPQKVKRVIWLTMAGGPSHLELFDPKPKLGQLHGQPMPESYTIGQQLAQLQGQKLMCLGPLFPFQKVGSQGTEISTLLP
ncbi:MAG: DUF1501 domain-containing protein, partial [Planctomycetota bacterium]